MLLLILLKTKLALWLLDGILAFSYLFQQRHVKLKLLFYSSHILPVSLLSALPQSPRPSSSDLLFFHFPSQKSRPPRDTNQTQHNKLQQYQAQILIIRQDKASWCEGKGPEFMQDSEIYFHSQESLKNIKLHNQNIYEEDLVHTNRDCVIVTSVSVSPMSPYQPCLVDHMDCFHDVLYPSTVGFSKLHLMIQIP